MGFGCTATNAVPLTSICTYLGGAGNANDNEVLRRFVAAVRAVARACATNPVAIAVPCHRVIGSDGSLTGYRWGVERKKKLLGMERG